MLTFSVLSCVLGGEGSDWPQGNMSQLSTASWLPGGLEARGQRRQRWGCVFLCSRPALVAQLGPCLCLSYQVALFMAPALNPVFRLIPHPLLL